MDIENSNDKLTTAPIISQTELSAIIKLPGNPDLLTTEVRKVLWFSGKQPTPRALESVNQIRHGEDGRPCLLFDAYTLSQEKGLVFHGIIFSPTNEFLFKYLYSLGIDVKIEQFLVIENPMVLQSHDRSSFGPKLWLDNLKQFLVTKSVYSNMPIIKLMGVNLDAGFIESIKDFESSQIYIETCQLDAFFDFRNFLNLKKLDLHFDDLFDSIISLPERLEELFLSFKKSKNSKSKQNTKINAIDCKSLRHL